MRASALSIRSKARSVDALHQEARIRATSAPEARRGKHLLELVGRRHFELVVAAIGGLLVRAPPEKDSRVAKPAALHVVVLDLTHSLDPKRLPREVFAGAPATLASRHASHLAAVRVGPFTPGVVLEGVCTERRELSRELFAHRHGERRGHADVVQLPPVVVKPEQQRADELVLSSLVPAKARHDTLGSS